MLALGRRPVTVTVAVDGTRIKASAWRHKAMSYDRM
jgi:hypothetical protein